MTNQEQASWLGCGFNPGAQSQLNPRRFANPAPRHHINKQTLWLMRILHRRTSHQQHDAVAQPPAAHSGSGQGALPSLRAKSNHIFPTPLSQLVSPWITHRSASKLFHHGTQWQRLGCTTQSPRQEQLQHNKRSKQHADDMYKLTTLVNGSQHRHKHPSRSTAVTVHKPQPLFFTSLKMCRHSTGDAAKGSSRPNGWANVQALYTHATYTVILHVHLYTHMH
jgi:hypothetical protein